jgi:hypothetical protein
MIPEETSFSVKQSTRHIHIGVNYIGRVRAKLQVIHENHPTSTGKAMSTVNERQKVRVQCIGEEATSIHDADIIRAFKSTVLSSMGLMPGY